MDTEYIALQVNFKGVFVEGPNVVNGLLAAVSIQPKFRLSKYPDDIFNSLEEVWAFGRSKGWDCGEGLGFHYRRIDDAPWKNCSECTREELDFLLK